MGLRTFAMRWVSDLCQVVYQGGREHMLLWKEGKGSKLVRLHVTAVKVEASPELREHKE